MVLSYVAEIVADVATTTIDVFTVNVALVAPAGTVTLDGTLAAALLPASATLAPPAGAGALRIKGNGTVSISAAVGMFTADGAGNLTSGKLDTNGVGTGAALTAQAFTGTYTIGADNRGVMTWNLPGRAVQFAVAMTTNGNARFIEFDASAGSGTIGSGTIESADTNAFSTASITGDYAFGVAGLDDSNNRAAIIGRFASDGTGTLTAAAGDLNAYGTPYTLSFTAASYTVSDMKTGRGTMNLAFTFGGTPANLNFVFYIVNAKRLLAMERDTVTTATPLLNGVVVQQQTPSGGFTNASLNGNLVIYLTGNVTVPVEDCKPPITPVGFSVSEDSVTVGAGGGGGGTVVVEPCSKTKGVVALERRVVVRRCGRTWAGRA